MSTKRDPLRIRRQPVNGEVVGYADRGERVEVLEPGEWPRIRCDGVEGYVSGAYLTAQMSENEVEQQDGQEDAPADGESTTLMREDGVCIVLSGRWRVAVD